MFHSSGKIIYDPNRFGMRRRVRWWCVVIVDKEITRYYRWWIERQYHIKGLCSPSWDAHISVIRGEEPKDELKHLWGKYHGRFVQFEYEHNPIPSTNDQHWVVNITCPELLKIREELQRPTNWPLHLTVGRVWF